jgi:hypothetical protein
MKSAITKPHLSPEVIRTMLKNILTDEKKRKDFINMLYKIHVKLRGLTYIEHIRKAGVVHDSIAEEKEEDLLLKMSYRIDIILKQESIIRHFINQIKVEIIEIERENKATKELESLIKDNLGILKQIEGTRNLLNHVFHMYTILNNNFCTNKEAINAY